MIRTLSRAMAITAITASALFSGMSPALAQGNWSWTDVSDKIAERQNRPMWAMAYASPFWYMTDGQELWSGGHVWKTEGSIMSDITSDVRNAGISRVDDIVSDGQTVLFLKNVAQHNNSIEVLAYNGSFMSLTSQVRSQLQSDEGLTQVVGRDGTWYLLTTKGRLFRVNASNGSTTRITLPNNIENRLQSTYGLMNYQVGAGSMNAMNALAMLPISGNQWILVAKNVDPTYTSSIYTFDGYNFTRDSSYSQDANAIVHASNGQDLLAGNCNSYSGQGSCDIHIYKNGQKTYTSIVAPQLDLITTNSKFVWNGSSWMILSGKRLARFDGSVIESLGQTRDLFLTVAGNGSGTFLLGGAESNEYSGNNPTYPLMLKLAKAQESYVANTNTNTNTNTTNVGGTYTSAYGPTLTVSGSPSNFTVANGDTFTYTLSASDTNGVNRTEIYANGVKIKTCESTYCDFSTQYYTNSLSTRAVPFYGIAVDNQGNVTQSPVQNLTINQYGTTSNTTNSTATTGNGGIQMWAWFEPAQSSIRRDQNVTYSVGTYDTDGIKRIEIYVNGNVARTCDLGRAYGNQTCSTSIYGGNYSLGTNVAINAKITEGTDQVAWTQLQNLYVTDVNGSNTTNTSGDVSAWTWLEPTGSVVNRNSSVTVKTQANASQGLNRVEVFVNGNLRRTCDYSRAYGTQSCDLTVNGSDYSNGSTLSLNAKATDYNGKIAWSDLKSVTVQDNGSTNTNTTNGNSAVWISSDPEKTDVMTNETVRFNVGANDNEGIRRIDIFVNGSVNRTCDAGYIVTGNYNCSYVIYGNSYSAGSVFYVNARVTDGNGNMTWSDAKTYTIKATSGSTTPSQSTNTNGSSWVWSDPNVSEIKTNESVRFSVGAYDAESIRRIEIVVNGSTAQSCDLGYAQSGNVQCSVVIHGSNYQSGSSVFVNAKITDGNGNVMWSDSKTYVIKAVDNGTTAPAWPTNGSGSVSITSNHDNGYKNNETISFAAVASDVDGVAKIEILVNGDLVKTCANVNSCGYTGGPYNDRNTVSYAVKMVDAKGFPLYDGYKTIYKK